MEVKTVDRKLCANPNFWQRILEDQALRDLDDLAKLIIGCEIVVALDDVTLLTSWKLQAQLGRQRIALRDRARRLTRV